MRRDVVSIRNATIGAITKQDHDDDRFAEAFDRHWENREGAGKGLVWLMLAPIGALLLFVVLHLAYLVVAAAAVGGGM